MKKDFNENKKIKKENVMRVKNLIILLPVVLLALAVGYWAGSSSNSMKMDSPNATEQTVSLKDKKDTSKEGRKVLYWKAPMNPSEIYDHPGKSKMGMDLVPVYEGETSAGSKGSVKIDPVTIQNMGVKTAMVQKGDFSKTVRTVGNISYDENRLYTVNLKYSGWIEKLYANYEGQMVRKGDPLLTIYSPDLVTTQQEYLLALNTRNALDGSDFNTIKAGGNSLLEAAQKRLDYWDLPASFVKNLKASGKIRKSILLHSPANGVIVHKNVIEGMHIKEGTNILQIADLSKVWLNASVYDYELPWIAKGQKVRMTLSYLPGETFTGYIDYIYPTLNQKARDVRVRIVFPNKNLELKPGMYANISIRGRTISNTLYIPSESVIHTGTRDIVFVDKGDGTFEPRQVDLGMEGGAGNNDIQVLSGLQQGEKIVTSAQFLIDSESRLQEAIQKMLKSKSPNMKMDKMQMEGKAPSSPGSMDNMQQKQKTPESQRQEHNKASNNHETK
jgi:multidrug efflux pump subunit AcrA (membrane-fusion protein)